MRPSTQRLADLRAKQRRIIERIEERTGRGARGARHQRGRSRDAQKTALFGVAQDGAQIDLLRAAVRHLRLSRHRRRGRGLLSRARRRAYQVAQRPRPLQGLHLDAEAERLSLDPYDRDRSRPPARRTADSHRRNARDRANSASPRTRSTRMPSARMAASSSPKESRAYPLAAGNARLLARWRQSRGVSRAYASLELFQDQVFCFTPKGGLIALPRGATPIDFAYAVHTKLGNSAVGAKINGRVGAGVVAAAKRRRGRDHPRRRAGAPGRLGGRGGDRQGARRDPTRDARRGAPAICRARPPDRRTRLRAGRPASGAKRN